MAKSGSFPAITRCRSIPLAHPFEPIRCHVFVTESTFGLPIYRWPGAPVVFDEINTWWRTNQTRGWASILYCYALGKARRILAGIDSSTGPIFTHGAVERMNQIYREAGTPLPATTYVGTLPEGTDWSRALILAPMCAGARSGRGDSCRRRPASPPDGCAFAVRRRRRAIDRGFVLSDHVDWPGLQQVIHETGTAPSASRTAIRAR